jgi:hypothetical protein
MGRNLVNINPSSKKEVVTEFKIIFFLLLLGISAELAFSYTKAWFSGDLRHLQTISNIAERIGNSDARSILLVGNSLIGEAIDISMLKAKIAYPDRPGIIIEKVVQDGTELTDWYFILKNHFLRVNRIPDVVFIGFAWENVRDQNSIPETRLAEFACALGDLPELLRLGLNDVDGVSRFALARCSSIYANHARIRNRILALFIPHYRDGTRVANDLQKAQTPPSQRDSSAPSYNLIETLLQLLNDRNVTAVFLAMPVADWYAIDPKLRSLFERSNIMLIDCRYIPGLFKGMYVDNMHLGEAGRQVFSRFFADYMMRNHPDILYGKQVSGFGSVKTSFEH